MSAVGFGAPTTAAVWLLENERSLPLPARPRRPDCELRILLAQQTDETHCAMTERVARRLLGLQRIHCRVRYVALFCGRAGNGSAARARHELAQIALRAMGPGGELRIIVDARAGEAARRQAVSLMEGLAIVTSGLHSTMVLQFESPARRSSTVGAPHESRC